MTKITFILNQNHLKKVEWATLTLLFTFPPHIEWVDMAERSVEKLPYPLSITQNLAFHTIYTRNNMCHKCGGNCGLWGLNKSLKKSYPEIFKKIGGAVWEIPAK